MTEIKARYFRYFRQSRFIPGVLKLEQSIFRTKNAYLYYNGGLNAGELQEAYLLFGDVVFFGISSTGGGATGVKNDVDTRTTVVSTPSPNNQPDTTGSRRS